MGPGSLGTGTAARPVPAGVVCLLITTSTQAAAGNTQTVTGAITALLIAAAVGALLYAMWMRLRTKSPVSTSSARSWQALRGLREGVIVASADGTIEFLNAAATHLCGFSADAAVGQPLHGVYRVIDEHSRAPLDYIAHDPTAQADLPDTSRIAVRLIRRDGSELSVHDSFSVIRDEGGRCTGYAVVFHDISQLRALSQQLSWQASHDSLTGLVNRRELEHCLSQLLASAQSQGKQHILLFIDLDNFKTVNDTCGHAAGDELLRSLAQLMGTKIRGSDTLARVGGDEFGALLPLCPIDQGLRIANAIREIVRDFRFAWEGKSFAVGASIGLVPIDAGSGTVADVLTAADACCYEAKNKGRDRVQVHRVQDVAPPAAGEPQMITRLTHAFEHGQFVLYQQYIKPLNEAVSSPHFEILVRMRGEDGELVLT
jgi:diguanylate cyclase (GGDEF)-like protein/PAS domain S-box-containing protein